MFVQSVLRVLGFGVVLCGVLWGQGPSCGATLAQEMEAQLRSRLGEPMSQVDLDLIMLGEDFFGAEPTGLRWRGNSLLFSWKRWSEPERRTWVWQPGQELAPWPEDEPEPGARIIDRRTGQALTRDGDSVFWDFQGERREVLRVAGGATGVRFLPDGEGFLWWTGRGVHRVGADGASVQLLAVQGGTREDEEKRRADELKAEAAAEPPKDLPEFHQREQRDLFRVLREKHERETKDQARRRKLRERRPRVTEYWAPKGFAVSSLVPSPLGDRAAVVLTSTDGPKSRTADMPDYVTADGYSAVRPTRTKVGDAGGTQRLEVVDLASGAVVRVQEPVEGRGAAPANPTFSPDGTALLAVARSDDDEEVWILKVDGSTGGVSVLHHRQDPAWINWSDCRPEWTGDDDRFVFTSEVTGWSQLYAGDAGDGTVRPLTSGAFEVRDVVPVQGEDRVLAVVTATSPHVEDLASINLESGEMELLATGGGRQFVLSEDGKWLAEVRSLPNQPWELFVRPLDKSLPEQKVTDSPSPAFRSYAFEAPPIVRFEASDGTLVPARIYRPKTPLPGRPAVLFVHGAGYLQNVHGWWSSYSREYGFHHLLRDEGYTVLDVDYRGSAGYGRDWRTAIYGHMGGRDLDDFVDAAAWLVKSEGCDPQRIGIYGGSYGGFITLMGLFTKPGVFSAGAALRPVTDWAHYNDGYTSNILDDPLESPVHYRRSSPIHFAEGLVDHLLICHGVLDDNVHAQDVFRLQQRLIELRKTDWEVAYYPLEAHGFRDAASWSDEYRRIHRLFRQMAHR